MKFLTTTAVAVLLAGAAGALAFAPAANADDAATAAPPPAAMAPAPTPDQQYAARGDDERGPMRHPGMGGRDGGMGPMGGGFAGGLMGLACGDRGAEALEIAFVHINYAVKPTAEQSPLFDSLKTAALADQKTYAAACQTAMAKPDGKPTLLDRLQSRLTLDQARVAALSDVLPKFKAFYDSLSDDQKTKLEPNRWDGPRAAFNGQWQHHGWRHNGPGQMGPMGGHPPAPAGAPAPDAPTADTPT